MLLVKQNERIETRAEHATSCGFRVALSPSDLADESLQLLLLVEAEIDGSWRELASGLAIVSEASEPPGLSVELDAPLRMRGVVTPLTRDVALGLEPLL